MNVGKAIADYLKARPTVIAKVADRVYWPESPAIMQDAPTASSLHIRVNELDGGHMPNLDAAFPVVQVSAFGKGKTDALALADVLALKDIILPLLSDARLVVDGVFIVSTLQSDPGPFSENGWWHAPMRFDLKYQEA